MKQIEYSFNFSLVNQPPQFSTPDTLLAIMNAFLAIQIEAQDPEGQNITFTLLRNGTIRLRFAYIRKQVFLDTYPSKNETLFIQAEDAMGAKNVLILHVNVTKCPCEHDGICVKKSTIIYPVQLSDYFCQCKKPYTGEFCENRPDPCKDQPCYPGLECSLAQNSEGFACESCPPLFKGDGKQCELDNNQGLCTFFAGSVIQYFECQLATDLPSLSCLKECEGILIPAYWQTCCNFFWLCAAVASYPGSTNRSHSWCAVLHQCYSPVRFTPQQAQNFATLKFSWN